MAKGAAKIDALLSAVLIDVTTTNGDRREFYRHLATGSCPELSHPQNETKRAAEGRDDFARTITDGARSVAMSHFVDSTQEG